MAEKKEKQVIGKAVYIREKHAVLEKDRVYDIYDKTDGGIRVWTDTGFCGIPNNDYTIVKG